MYHSISFGDKNTWTDWHLVPKSRPVVNPPSPKTNYIDIPGANGSVDISQAISGDIVYSNREGSWDFIVMNGYSDWAITYSNVMDYLHGRRMKVILEDDSSYYYEGRISVNQWNSEEHYSTISIDYNLAPYKKEVDNSMLNDDWLWDPFNFEDGIIRDYKDITVDGKYELLIPSRRMPVVPIFTLTSGQVTVSLNGASFNLSQGTNRIVNIILVEGDNNLIFTGNGVVSVDYTGGRL